MSQMVDYKVGVSRCEAASFHWSQRCRDGAVVVSLAGELDLASAQFGPVLLRLAESAPAATIVLDASELRFIDAYGVGLIVNARKAARAHGRALQVSGLRGLPARVFGLLGLEQALCAGREAPCRKEKAGGR